MIFTSDLQFEATTMHLLINEDICIPTTTKRKQVIVLAELSTFLDFWYFIFCWRIKKIDRKFQSIYMNWSDVWTKFWNDKSNICICRYSFCRFFMPEIMCCNLNVLIRSASLHLFMIIFWLEITTNLYISISLNFDLLILLLLRTCVDYNVNLFPIMPGLRQREQTNRWLIKIADITAIHNKHKS